MSEAAHTRIASLFDDPKYRWYAWGKLRSDPIYERVAFHLKPDSLPILDVGCGIGLMSFYLGWRGTAATLTGIDADRRKIDAAIAACRRWQPAFGPLYASFHEGDARSLPDLSGHVLLLDVVHYVAPDHQQLMFAEAARRVRTGGRLILRDALQDGSWRSRITMFQERFSRGIGWLRGERLEFPRLELLDQWAAAAGLRRIALEPMTRGNPFNNHLIVWERADAV